MRDEGPALAPAPGRAALLGPRLVAIGLLALGLFILQDALQMARGGGFRPVGPGFTPTIVAVGLVLLAAALLVRTTLRPDAHLAEHAAEEAAATSWPIVGAIAVALVAYALLLEPLGYILATAGLVPIAARVLGSRRPLRDALTGFAMAVGIWFVFTAFLGVRLPAGVLDPFV